MTYFSEELLTKIQNKEELDHNMEAMFRFLKEHNITGEQLQADPVLFHHFSEAAIYPYICKAMLFHHNRNLLHMSQMDPEDAANSIYITFCRRLSSLMKSIEKRPDISIHQILNRTINNMVIDLIRTKSRKAEKLKGDLFWSQDVSYTMDLDSLFTADDRIHAIVLASTRLEKHHQLAFLGISVAGIKPATLMKVLNRKGNTLVLEALIQFTSRKYNISRNLFHEKLTPAAFDECHFTAKVLSDLNSYVIRKTKQSLTKTTAKQK